MKKIRFTYIALILCFLLQFGLGNTTLYAQNALQRRMGVSRDSIQLAAAKKDSLLTDSLNRRNQLELKRLEAPIDTAILATKTDSATKETFHSGFKPLRMACFGIPWRWTNLQPEILETSDCIWWFRRMYLRFKLEQQNV